MMIHLRSLRAFNNVTYPLNNGNKSQSIGNTPARARARVCAQKCQLCVFVKLFALVTRSAPTGMFQPQHHLPVTP